MQTFLKKFTLMPIGIAVLTSMIFNCSVYGQDEPKTENPQTDNAPQTTEQEDSVANQTETAETEIPAALNFTMKSIDGDDVELSQYLGNVVVIVNTASKCGRTPQYQQLQELSTKYADQGVKVLGFPCNQFGGQEPGSLADIKEFCTKNYGVTFDMFSKIDVNGPAAADLYKYLTAQKTKPAAAGKVNWNFEKFILDKTGTPIARFGSKVKPDSKEFMEVIDAAVAE